MTARSQPITRSDEAELNEWIRALVGRELLSVHYRMAPGSHWVHSPMPAGVHEVDWDVVLRLSGEILAVVGWSMDGFIEGLNAKLNDTEEAASMEEVDVSETPDWRRLLGETIVSVQAAWHIPSDGCPQTLWGIRIFVSGDFSVAVSLGKVEDGKLEYQPDALLVLFDEPRTTAFAAATGAAYLPGAGTVR